MEDYPERKRTGTYEPGEKHLLQIQHGERKNTHDIVQFFNIKMEGLKIC